MLKNRTATLSIALAVFCLLPIIKEANAVFKVNEPSSKSVHIAAVRSLPEPVTASVKYVVQSGKATPELISSIGSDLPLSIALDRIMPAGWKLSGKSQTHLLEKKASWDSFRRPLDDTLTEVGQNAQVRFFVNWDKKTVTVLPLETTKSLQPVPAQPLSAAKPVAVVQKEEISDENQKPTSGIFPRKINAKPTPEVSQELYKPKSSKIITWKLEKASLRRQLEVLCERQEPKWNMVWNSSLEDYILPVTATFKGEFIAVVHEVFLVLRKTSDCGLKPKFYRGNNTLAVRDI